MIESTGPDTEILLVNNHPPYYDVDNYLKGFSHPRVKVLDSGRNLSHILGTQFAEKFAQGDYLVRMDDDAVVPRNNWIEVMFKALNQFPDLAYIGLPPHGTPLPSVNRVITPAFTIVYVDFVLFTCVMFNRNMWKAHFILQPQGIYGYDDVYSAQIATQSGFKIAYLVSHPCEHLARASGNDPLYGAWKILYVTRATSVDFPAWGKRVKRITPQEEEYLRIWGFSPEQILEIKNLIAKKQRDSNTQKFSIPGSKTQVFSTRKSTNQVFHR